ncbi:MAG: DUF4405 domain-containing protein [Candidatus Omnitrophota bacterium]
MNKALALRIVNPILALSFVVQAVTGIIMLLRIKTPYTHLVFEAHEHNGLLMIALVTAHLTLNWGWITATFFKKSNPPKK